MNKPTTLEEYFEENWQGGTEKRAYPIIDHSLRITKMDDGRFTFYIHPSICGGNTMNFIIEMNSLTTQRVITATDAVTYDTEAR